VQTATIRCFLFIAFALSLSAATAVTGPVLHLPADFTVPAIGPTGAYATFTATSTGRIIGDDENGRPVTVICSPASGSLFPIGITTVRCLATDDFGTTSGSFRLTVADKAFPELTLPAGIAVDATSEAGAVVEFTATAFDLVDGPLNVACAPPSGSTFPTGTTIVSCSAGDSAGNVSRGTFGVTVIGSAPPVLLLPDIVSEATGPTGAEVAFEAAADGGIAISCLPQSGSLFPVGTTPVSCTAIGVSGGFKVTVVDTTIPTLLLPAPITAAATSADGAVVSFSASATDLVDGPLTVECTPPSGATFALGTTTVNCFATDSHFNTSNGSFTVTVVDMTAPLIVNITATPNVLWPPNHQLVPVTIAVTAIDNVDPGPISRIYAITSNEPVVGAGSGTTSFDWQITGQLTVDLRAERSGSGNGRLYTIHIECIDEAGNRSTGIVTVLVPHDQRQRSVRRR
jgi:hypothetical protein